MFRLGRHTIYIYAKNMDEHGLHKPGAILSGMPDVSNSDPAVPEKWESTASSFINQQKWTDIERRDKECRQYKSLIMCAQRRCVWDRETNMCLSYVWSFPFSHCIWGLINLCLGCVSSPPVPLWSYSFHCWQCTTSSGDHSLWHCEQTRPRPSGRRKGEVRGKDSNT